MLIRGRRAARAGRPSCAALDDPALTPLSDAARILIRRHIDSVGRLDLLLTLHGDPRVRWSADRMARQMRASQRWSEGQLVALEEAGLLVREPGPEGDAWHFSPRTSELAEAMEDLVSACRLDWPGVTREVVILRPGGADAFSDAFRIRRSNG